MLPLSVVALGFLHGLGADHLMAIATLSAGASRDEPHFVRTFAVALRFALGHALLLVFGTTLVLVLGWNIPVVIEQAGETLGGLVLIALGVTTLWAAWTRRVYVHRHQHVHEPGHVRHSHWHVHLGREHRHVPDAGHPALPGLLGGVFAVSGLRALTLLAPFESVGGSVLGLLGLVALFALGILISMSMFGILLARIMRSPRMTSVVAETAAVATAVGAIGLGAYWTI